jgi:arginine decarboxylase-like protein
VAARGGRVSRVFLSGSLKRGGGGLFTRGVRRQVLRCRQLGIDAIVVLEQFQELGTLLDAVERLCPVQPPVIGVRAKLHTRHK